ncbi:MAG: hypothetical protein HOV80_33785, partial [Polyangiaceae bacterium]|nr:hypothetical protein [Polyangiaceae bacterium]
MRRLTPFLLALVCVPFACSTVDTEDGDDGGGKKKKEEVDPTYVGVPGITVRQVAIYQSLKRTLMVDGGPGAGEVPLVAGRDAVVRVFYEDDGTYDGSEITARLEVEGGDPIELTAVLGGASVDEDMNSTINFVVPGDRVGQSFNYSVGLLVEGDEEDENSAARWPAEGLESVAVEGPQNKLRVILAPFQYNYDGSGRVPDMSPEAVEGYRQRLKAIYPVSDVEVSVRQATPWNQYIGPGGEGWQQVGYTVYGFRQQDGTPDDVYYYGIFDPEASFYAYCGGGCLLGVTLLNNQPPATGSVDLRLALGVGFPQYAADTMAHELGHSHGREHAPCGGPDSVDPQYPYAGAKIGIWGLDTVSMQLISPDTYTDIMGYCEKQWVSDYTYKALLARGQNVNLPDIHGATRVPAAMIGIDAKGHATFAGESTAPVNLGGRSVKASFVDSHGNRNEATARYFEYDHLPGG